MNIKRMLEKILNLNSKILPKYRHISQRWWREPEEDYLLAEFGMRMFMGLAIATWFLSSIALVFAIINYLSQSISGAIGWGIGTVLLTIVGFSIFSSSNDHKRIFELEKLKYQEAKENKPSTHRRMDTLCIITEKNISDILTTALKNTENFKSIVGTIEDLVILTTDAQKSIKEIYNSNRAFNYNVNEPMEVESFSVVDCFKECDTLLIRLEEIAILLNNCRAYALKEDEKLFSRELEVLFNFIGKSKS